MLFKLSLVFTVPLFLLACSGNSSTFDQPVPGSASSSSSSGGDDSSSTSSSSGASSSGSSTSSSSSSSGSSTSGSSSGSSSSSSGSSASSSGAVLTTGVAALSADSCVSNVVPATSSVHTSVNYLTYTAGINSSSSVYKHKLTLPVEPDSQIFNDNEIEALAQLSLLSAGDLATRNSSAYGQWLLIDGKIKLFDSTSGTIKQISAIDKLSRCNNSLKQVFMASDSAPELHFVYNKTGSCDGYAKVNANMTASDQAIALPAASSITGQAIYQLDGSLLGYIEKNDLNISYREKTYCKLDSNDGETKLFSQPLLTATAFNDSWQIEQLADSALLMQLGSKIHYVSAADLSGFLAGTSPAITLSLNSSAATKIRMKVLANKLYYSDLSLTDKLVLKVAEITPTTLNSSELQTFNDVQPKANNLWLDNNSVWLSLDKVIQVINDDQPNTTDCLATPELCHNQTVKQYQRWDIAASNLDVTAQWQVSAEIGPSVKEYWQNNTLWLVANGFYLAAKLSANNAPVEYASSTLINPNGIFLLDLLWQKKNDQQQSFALLDMTDVSNTSFPLSLQTQTNTVLGDFANIESNTILAVGQQYGPWLGITSAGCTIVDDNCVEESIVTKYSKADLTSAASLSALTPP